MFIELTKDCDNTKFSINLSSITFFIPLENKCMLDLQVDEITVKESYTKVKELIENEQLKWS